MKNEDNKEMKLVFAPGCFDSFEGTQEELDAMQAEIMQMFENGDFMENAEEIDMEAMMEDEPEMAMKLMSSMDALENKTDRKRTLQ